MQADTFITSSARPAGFGAALDQPVLQPGDPVMDATEPSVRLA